jgi:hypothetical protein
MRLTVVVVMVVMMVPSVMVVRSRVCDGRNRESGNQDGGKGCFHCPISSE